MSNIKNSWWRSWHGAPTDNKWILIGQRASVPPGVVSAVVWALMDYASQNEDCRGSISGFDVETYCAFSGFKIEQVEAIISALTDKGIIEAGTLTSWEKRQPQREDAGAAARKRAERDRKKMATSHNVSHNVTQRHAPETETETETEKNIPLPPFLNPQAWEDFVQYRKEIKNPLTPRAEKAILNKLEKFNAEGQDTTEIINESISSGWAGVFPLKNRKGSSHIRSGSNGTGQSKTWTIMPDGRLKKPDGTFWKKTEDGGLVPL